MFLEGNEVYFRPLSVEDAEDFYQWACDREVVKYSLSSFSYPKSKYDLETWLKNINNDAKTFSLGICVKDSDKLIGYAGIASISTLNKSGEYFILIGNKSFWGKGIATETTQIITDYGFNTLGLHRVELTAYNLNPAAYKAYEKAGYVHEGVKRQSGFRDGKFHDKVMMSALATEWQSNKQNIE